VTGDRRQNADRSRSEVRTGLVLCAAIVAAILLALPSLFSPLLQDDVMHRSMVQRQLPGIRWGPTELYDFLGGPTRPAAALRDAGVLPWFTADDLKLRFFRPLSSATLVADMYLFGDRLWLSRLHSLGWFLAALCLVAALHARFLPARTAALATFMYAVAGGHSMPISWLAARHSLISSTFALLAFWCYARWRADGWRAGRWLAIVSFAVGLLAGEMAVGAVALIAAWELVGRRQRLRDQLPALAPFAAIALIYLLFYVGADYGARSSAYTGLREALTSPLLVLRHFWILIADLATALPADVVGAGPMRAEIGIAALGAVAAAAVAYGLRAESRARWLSVAVALAILPGTLAIVGGRVLTIALFASTALVALAIQRGVQTMRDRERLLVTRSVAGVAVCALGLIHCAGAPAIRVTIAREFARLAVEEERQASRVPRCPGVMVIVAASDPIISTYLPVRLGLRGRAPERYHVLSFAPVDHRIEQVTPTSFELTSARPEGPRPLWERLFRATPVPAGTRVTMPHLEATVLEARDGAPARVRFVFDEPLDSPHLCFFQWKGQQLSLLAPPKPGDAIDLPHEPGPAGF
jgi:hypothetical protein